MMDRAPRRPRGLGSHRRRAIDDQLPLDQLAAPVAAPDMTRTIMGRLGYMQVPRRVALKSRLRRWSRRVWTVGVLALAMMMASHWYCASPDARRPDGLTIPAAVGSDLERQQDRIGNVIRVFQKLSPTSSPSVPPSSQQFDDDADPPCDDVNRSFMAPVRWV